MTDPRVAHYTASHRGMSYRRHGVYPRTLPLEWSDEMAYVVGLMATDGCLINTGRHLSFDSADEQLVRTFLRCLGRSLNYAAVPTRTGGVAYQARFSDVRFYQWLLTIGLMPRKSLTLGAIDVSDRFLLPVVRGLLDGDGHISNFVHHPTPGTFPEYEYERFWVYFNSASRPHIEWLKQRLSALLSIDGYIERRPPREGRREFFRLKYGKHASSVLMQRLYEHPQAPRLERKWAMWDRYARKNGLLCGRRDSNPHALSGTAS